MITGMAKRSHAAAVVLASGSGTRVGADVNKVYLPLAGRRLVSWSLEAFARVPGIRTLVLVTRPQDHDLVEWVLEREFDGAAVEVVHGGRTRQESELKALRHLAERIGSGAVDTVLLHDGARPLASRELIAGVLQAARRHGGAVPGLAADDIMAAVPGGLAKLPAGTAIRAQTPQAFHARPLLDAYEEAARQGFDGTDTSSVMERFSPLPIEWVAGEPENIKVTYAHDLVIAEQVLASANYRR
ncbi:IspD/TarI family cytidylyltransferase [Amycolatopsis viridis]|nr:IspD/TarI family cytidylyltransferase [Amycolatopsis viridis]